MFLWSWWCGMANGINAIVVSCLRKLKIHIDWIPYLFYSFFLLPVEKKYEEKGVGKSEWKQWENVGISH